MAHQHFQHLHDWQLAVCRECRIAIWPDYIQSYLQGGQHRLPYREAQAVADEVHLWPGLV